jgi:hypothetical protein
MFCAFSKREKITEAILAFGTVFSPKPFGILLDQKRTISTPFSCVTAIKIADCPCSWRPTLGFQNIFIKSPAFAALNEVKFVPRSSSRAKLRSRHSHKLKQEPVTRKGRFGGRLLSLWNGLLRSPRVDCRNSSSFNSRTPRTRLGCPGREVQG